MLFVDFVVLYLLLFLHGTHCIKQLTSWNPIAKSGANAGLLPNGCGEWGYWKLGEFPDRNGTLSTFVPLNTCQASGAPGVCGPSYIWKCSGNGLLVEYYQCWSCDCQSSCQPILSSHLYGGLDAFECGGPSCSIRYRIGCNYNAPDACTAGDYGEEIYVYGACNSYQQKYSKNEIFYGSQVWKCNINSTEQYIWPMDKNPLNVENCPANNPNIKRITYPNLCGTDIGPECYNSTFECNVAPNP